MYACTFKAQSIIKEEYHTLLSTVNADTKIWWQSTLIGSDLQSHPPWPSAHGAHSKMCLQYLFISLASTMKDGVGWGLTLKQVFLLPLVLVQQNTVICVFFLPEKCYKYLLISILADTSETWHLPVSWRWMNCAKSTLVLCTFANCCRSESTAVYYLSPGIKVVFVSQIKTHKRLRKCFNWIIQNKCHFECKHLFQATDKYTNKR